jgi:hypothetical protein
MSLIRSRHMKKFAFNYTFLEIKSNGGYVYNTGHQEEEIQRIFVQGQSRQKVHKTHLLKAETWWCHPSYMKSINRHK